MIACFKPACRVFEFRIWEGHPAPLSPRSLPPKLANLLSAMPRLEHLVFVVPEESRDLFEKEFFLAKLAMPSVKTLVVGPDCEFMVTVCPKVAEISNNGHLWMILKHSRDPNVRADHSMRLIKAAGTALKLQHFEMMDFWEPSLLEGTFRLLRSDFGF